MNKAIQTKNGDRVDLLLEGTAIMIQTTSGALSGPAFTDAAGGAELAAEIVLAALKLNPTEATLVLESYGIDSYTAAAPGEEHPEVQERHSAKDHRIAELEAEKVRLAKLTADVLAAAGLDPDETRTEEAAIAFVEKLRTDLKEEGDQAERSRRDFMQLCEAAGIAVDTPDAVAAELARMKDDLSGLRAEKLERLKATPVPADQAPATPPPAAEPVAAPTGRKKRQTQA